MILLDIFLVKPLLKLTCTLKLTAERAAIDRHTENPLIFREFPNNYLYCQQKLPSRNSGLLE